MNKTTLLSISMFACVTFNTIGQNTDQNAGALVQFIHNAPDDALFQIDVYVNGTLVADDLAFRTSTPFINVAAGIPLVIDVAHASSTASAQRFYSLTTTFTESTSQVIVADGVESTIGLRAGYPFTLFPHSVRQGALIAANSDIMIHHGFSASPKIGMVVPAGPGEVVTEDIFYRANASNYIEAAATDHTIKVYNGMNYVASYIAPLRTLGLQGHAIVLLGSGFLDQFPDRSDPEYGVFLAVADGGNLIPLPLLASNMMSFAEANINMHPNPADRFLRFEFPFAINQISAAIIDNAGSTIRTVDDFGDGIDVSDLPEGIYTINLFIDNRMYTDKFVKRL